ncbi:hypothetical protein GC105_05055 [Alkalibaculum sp. M08DMB]|uniref:YvrJ family protein n=1 Tax=Alkalibaculum sporogenes TaxID=2655001 RepID=A0A6A7K7H5_9FIRM|nr:hypothetical protein [Alkalibaculum sporogenes]MPW25157.1 hypothetical protein [Alkalibaculum sporogenes]
MNDFMLGISSLTTLLNPFMTFVFLLAATLFLFNLRDKVNKTEDYIKSIAISLHKISNELANRD